MAAKRPEGFDSWIDWLITAAPIKAEWQNHARAELAALRARLAAWEECAEPFEITNPAEFQKEIKRLMDDPMDWMLSLDKAMRERDELRAQVSAVKKEKNNGRR